jgi:hypothetical protein
MHNTQQQNQHTPLIHTLYLTPLSKLYIMVHMSTKVENHHNIFLIANIIINIIYIKRKEKKLHQKKSQKRKYKMY